MKAYEQLTYRGQAARMRALAREALARFPVRKNARLTLCNHGENTVFAVHGARGIRFALRIHRLDYQSPAAIRSEMAWLSALARDTDLPVPRPEAGRDGAMVQTVAHPGVPGARSVVLLHWVDGALVGARTGMAFYEQMGAMTGALHAHSDTWKRPRSFRRPRWDERGLLIEPIWGDPLAAPGLHRRQRDVIDKARRRLVDELRAFGKGQRRFGLIHADLHFWNVLRHRGAIAPIDFDDCGFGWHLYDMVVGGLGGIWLDPDRRDEKLARYVAGYRRHRRLADDDLALVPTFLTTRRVMHLGWLASRSDNPELAAMVQKRAQVVSGICRDYLAS